MAQNESIQQIHVVAAVVERAGRFLVCRRPIMSRHGGLWEFPGGKLRHGEDHAAAALRELKEELGVSVRGTQDIIYSVRDGDSLFVISFVRVEILGDPEPLEHEELRWAAPEEMANLDFAPSDARFVRAVLGVNA